MRARIIVIIGIVVLSAFALSSCSTQARAERKGKEAGEQICKAKDADNADEAARHVKRANDKLDDLARFTGRSVNDDMQDFERNMNQMASGNATEQDVNAIIRNVEAARATASGNAEAAFDGLLEALNNCD
jgi:hypothetical protein